MERAEKVKVEEWDPSGSLWITGNQALKEWGKLSGDCQDEAKANGQLAHMTNGRCAPQRFHWVVVQGEKGIGVIKVANPRWRLFCFRINDEWHVGHICKNPSNSSYGDHGKSAARVRFKFWGV